MKLVHPKKHAIYFPEGTKLLCAGDENVLQIWNVALEVPILELEIPKLCHDMSIAPDGRRIALTDGSGIEILDAFTGDSIRTFDDVCGEAACCSVAYVADAIRLVAGWGDGLIRIFNANSVAVVAFLGKHPTTVSSSAGSPDGSNCLHFSHK